jgi:hypothetical protein
MERWTSRPITWEEIDAGDLVKASVGGERLWFKVIRRSEAPFALICEFDSIPVGDIVFTGQVTLSRDWLAEAHRPVRLAAVND